MRRPLQILSWLVALVTGAAAWSAPELAAAPQEPEQARVRATARFEPTTAPPGADVTLHVDLAIEDGWHIYGALENETGTPSALVIEERAGLVAMGDAVVPPGAPHDTAGIMSYWVEGEATITQRFTVPAGTSGALELKGRVDYMACTPDFCEQPTSAAFTATLTVADAIAQDPPKTDVGDPLTGGDLPGLPGLPGLGDAAPKLRVEARVEPSPVRPGETAVVVLKIDVDEGWHVYGRKDADPIRFEVTPPPTVAKIGDAQLPDGEPHEVTKDLTSYWLEGSFEMSRTLTIADDAAAGESPLDGVVHYMPCDVNECLDPTQTSFSTTLVIENGAPRAEYAEAAVAAATAQGDGGDDEQGLLALLIAAIGAGLFALLMPCTYPMIPITISFFTKQAETRGGNVLPLSLTYGLGIVAIFIVIGLLFAPWIVPFATHWLTNAIIATVFVVFAFALFGYITIQPPQFLMQAAGKASTKGGYIGVFLMGACLVVTSFTCTVPFVGTILALAAKGNMLDVVIGMGTFGLTMAVPFVVLSLLPGRMRAMPRSGEWMNTLKVFLGFVELAAALKFVSNVDVVVNHGPLWLTHDVFLWLWVAIFVAAGAYLLGLLSKTAGKPGLGRLGGAAVSLAFAGYCVTGAIGSGFKNEVMIALVPPLELGDHEIVKDDYDRAIELARRDDKLVLINFTGFT